MALAGSMVPLVIGLAFIGLWGIRNDPIYHSMEKAKGSLETSDDTKEDDVDVSEEDVVEEMDDDIVGEITTEDIPEEFTEPLPETDSVEEIEDATKRSTELKEEHAKVPEIRKAPSDIKMPALKPEIKPEMKKELDELDDFDLEFAKAEEEKRVQRCEKMLNAAVILPDDKQRLRALIPTGISLHDFTEELKFAVNKRKKKEEEKEVTSDEKASIIEDELIAELGELANDLEDNDEDGTLEDAILKELDDLGDL
jgi:hypothetical protein